MIKYHMSRDINHSVIFNIIVLVITVHQIYDYIVLIII